MNIKKIKFKKKLAGAVIVASAFFIGFMPITAFAHSNEDAETEVVESQTETEPQTEQATEAVTEEPQGPLTPDGNLSLVDDYGSTENGGKQFITVVTKKGNYFYIIIDRDDKGQQTVHFLNMVDESDLLSLMDDDEAKDYVDSIASTEDGNTENVEQTKANTEESTEPIEQPQKKVIDKMKDKGTSKKMSILALVCLLTAGGIIGYLYLRNVKKKDKKQEGEDPDLDYEDDEEDYLAEISTDEENTEEFEVESENEEK